MSGSSKRGWDEHVYPAGSLIFVPNPFPVDPNAPHKPVRITIEISTQGMKIIKELPATPAKECCHGHTVRRVGCVSCVLVFDRPAESSPLPPQGEVIAKLERAHDIAMGLIEVAKSSAEDDGPFSAVVAQRCRVIRDSLSEALAALRSQPAGEDVRTTLDGPPPALPPAGDPNAGPGRVD